MWPFVVLGVYVYASQRISLATLARNPHKGPNGEISHETGSGGGKEGQRERERAVDNGERRRTVGLG